MMPGKQISFANKTRLLFIASNVASNDFSSNPQWLTDSWLLQKTFDREFLQVYLSL